MKKEKYFYWFLFLICLFFIGGLFILFFYAEFSFLNYFFLFLFFSLAFFILGYFFKFRKNKLFYPISYLSIFFVLILFLEMFFPSGTSPYNLDLIFLKVLFYFFSGFLIFLGSIFKLKRKQSVFVLMSLFFVFLFMWFSYFFIIGISPEVAFCFFGLFSFFSGFIIKAKSKKFYYLAPMVSLFFLLSFYFYFWAGELFEMFNFIFGFLVRLFPQILFLYGIISFWLLYKLKYEKVLLGALLVLFVVFSFFSFDLIILNLFSDNKYSCEVDSDCVMSYIDPEGFQICVNSGWKYALLDRDYMSAYFCMRDESLSCLCQNNICIRSDGEKGCS